MLKQECVSGWGFRGAVDDYVGDMAETVALLWPKRAEQPAEIDDGTLRIGAVENFPFLDPPLPRMIADGYQLLAELGAVDENNRLTSTGWQLAKFPIDPKIARMIVAANKADLTCPHSATEAQVATAPMSQPSVTDTLSELVCINSVNPAYGGPGGLRP